jgi:hypothetical protein
LGERVLRRAGDGLHQLACGPSRDELLQLRRRARVLSHDPVREAEAVVRVVQRGTGAALRAGERVPRLARAERS